MLRRAAFMAVTFAPALPGLAWAQATPERATSLQQQIQGWLQTTIGSAVAVSPSPVQVTAAGDHFDLAVPIGVGPAAPNLTGKMTDAGGGRWAIDDVRLPSPSVFHFKLPPSKAPGALGGDVTTTLTAGEQNQRLLLDPNFATPSTWTQSIKDLGIATTAPNLTQLSHIDSGVGASTMTPTSDGRVDIAVNSAIDGYSIKMSTEQKMQPISIVMGKITLVGNVVGASRDRMMELTRAVSALKTVSVPNQPSTVVPPNRETSRALLTALADLATGVSFDEKISDLAVTVQGLSGSLASFSVGLASKANGGKLDLQMPLSAEGLTLPELGLGGAAKLIPTKLSFTPTLTSVPTGPLMRVASKLADKQDPEDDDYNNFFSQGPITAGIDNFFVDVAGSSFAGNFKVLASAPNVVSGTGQVTADNIDRLQQVMSSDPQTAQATPLLIFLKGVGRVEQNRLVWDIVYRDGHVLVNGQDMTALAGAAAPPAAAPAPRPRQPQGAAPARPSPRPAPKP